MIYDNPSVRDYVISETGKLIHIFGEADAGRTEVLFSWINAATEKEKIVCYIAPQATAFKAETFKERILHPDQCVIGFAGNVQTLSALLKSGADLYFIDNFLEYILHKKKKSILSVFSSLSAAAYQNRTNLVLVNDMRYHPGKGGMHPAYMEYFRHYCNKHIRVEKDSDFHIHYGFTEI